MGLLGVVVAGGLVAADIGRGLSGQPKLCRALDARVAGLESFRWDNGMTESAASWGQVLTDGVSNAADADRTLIARAVRNDEDGYAAFLAALPASSRSTAGRLRDVAIDPTADPGTLASVESDATELLRLGQRECGFA